MLENSPLKSKNIRVYSQLIASIIKSSAFGLIVYFCTILFAKRSTLRVNNVLLGVVIVGLVMVYGFPLIVENSLSGISYTRTLLLWSLPIIYYAIGVNDLNNKTYERLLLIMMIYSVCEFLMINFTGVSLFESDRMRSARNFGFIRSEGVAHNSSISSALIISIFLKIYLEKGLSIKTFVIALTSILFLGSGAGMLLFIFAIVFFIINRIILIVLSILSLILLGIFFTQLPAMEILGNIHPKISYEYISFIWNFKLEQLAFMLDTDYRDILLGFSLRDNAVVTSGDFGYGTMLLGVGLGPALFLMFGISVMFIRASRIGNFAPFFILMIETFHYPAFVDPISAYLMAQYAIAQRSEE
jgi:hypothetical protein|tara:strand:- start:289 stop:1359 length:1071 start_codon:yes stop_codon:yes gene_type:complete